MEAEGFFFSEFILLAVYFQSAGVLSRYMMPVSQSLKLSEKIHTQSVKHFLLHCKSNFKTLSFTI